MIRGIIQTIAEGVIKRFAASGRAGETFANREYFQHYGFTSRPLAGAEAIIIKDGNHIVMVASDDRRYRLAIENGEVAIYTDEGDKIHLKRGRIIDIVGGEQINMETKAAATTASTSSTVTSPSVTINASGSCQVNSPAINLGGDRDALERLVDERFLVLFHDHTHDNVVAGSAKSGTVTQTISADDCCTTTTKAN